MVVTFLSSLLLLRYLRLLAVSLILFLLRLLISSPSIGVCDSIIAAFFSQPQR